MCRRCKKPSLFRVDLALSNLSASFEKTGALTAIGGDLEPAFEIKGMVSLADIAEVDPPADLPEPIEDAFSEGAKCFAIGCFNAAATMFRLSLDLATKQMLPDVDEAGGPNSQERRNLAPRLRWLFANGKLPADLQPLSEAVKENGDDGAHAGILDKNEAEDLLDFARALLERLYTEPAKLAAARQRVIDRRAAP